MDHMLHGPGEKNRAFLKRLREGGVGVSKGMVWAARITARLSSHPRVGKRAKPRAIEPDRFDQCVMDIAWQDRIEQRSRRRGKFSDFSSNPHQIMLIDHSWQKFANHLAALVAVGLFAGDGQ